MFLDWNPKWNHNEYHIVFLLSDFISLLYNRNMPIYEYKCLECKKEFEVIVPLNTDVICSTCGSSNLKKLVSGFSTKSDRTRYEEKIEAKAMMSGRNTPKKKRTLPGWGLPPKDVATEVLNTLRKEREKKEKKS